MPKLATCMCNGYLSMKFMSGRFGDLSGRLGDRVCILKELAEMELIIKKKKNQEELQNTVM